MTSEPATSERFAGAKVCSSATVNSWREDAWRPIVGLMSDLLPAGAKISPATARNRHPILEVLKPRLPTAGLVLEIAAGAGEHAVYNAAAFPGLQWQPTDANADALASIAAWRDHVALPNLLPPLQLDACDPDAWPIYRADAIVTINMIHISSVGGD